MTACGDTVFRRTQLLGGLTKEYRNAAKPPPRPDRPWSNPGAQILKPHTLTWTVQVWVEGIGVSRSPLAGWAALAWVGFIARAAVCESLSPPSSAGPPGPAGKRWPANTARPSPALADCTCVVGGVVVSPLVDPVSGWLAGRLGDAWLNLLHGSPDERLVRRSMADAVEAVMEEAEPESREAMRSGLALCFNKPPPASLGADPAGGLRDAVAAQVALLREMQAADGTGRMFFDSVPVEEEWLTAELTNAFEAALREGVAPPLDPAELVQALDAQWIRASLSELRDLLRRLVPPAESSLARCLIGVIPAAADCFQAREVAIRLEVAAGSSEAVVPWHVLAGMGGGGQNQLAP